MRIFLTNFLLLSLSVLLVSETALVSRAQTGNPQTSVPDLPAIIDEEAIKIDTTLINLPVSVFDKKGQFVPNLAQNDFRVYENGVEQKIEYFASEEQPFTVVLLLDVSASVRANLKDIKKAALSFVDQLKQSDKVVGITFDSRLKVLNKRLNDREGLRAAIAEIKPAGGTNLYATVEVVGSRLLKRFDKRKALILFTDGVDANPYQFYGVARSTYETSLREAVSSGAVIYCVQFLSEFQPENELADSYLSALAELSGGRLYRAKKAKKLEAAFASIAAELRSQYSLGYYPQTSIKAGERRQIKVLVNQPNATVKTRSGYHAEQ